MNDLAENELRIIKILLKRLTIGEKAHAATDVNSNAATIAMYQQNFLFLRHILKFEKKNQQIIELLTKMSDKE